MKFKWILHLLLLLAISLPVPMLATEIIAHRGASYDAPENTLAAFRLGFEQGADAIELDVHLSKDSQLIVLHDPDTKRTGGVETRVAEQVAAELQKINVGEFGTWKGRGFSEKIPLLQEVFPLVPKDKRLFIEIKSGLETVPPFVKVIRESKLSPRQLPIITFKVEVAREIKRLLPEHEVSFLHSWKKNEESGEYPRIEELISRAREAKLDGLDLQYGFPINKAFVDKVHAAGLKLYTWTVDDPEVGRAHQAAGVDGITTNRPQWLRSQLAQKE
ncbi:MAG: glycerophosphodiester phosphodiesterase [Verrucomicrobiota bacterium]|nr:glycerophosphodiester phosphodiesterase [Verrucomicrobiota bacterium]